MREKNRNIVRIQWMRNAEAGQRFGNQQEIRRLNESLYRMYIKSLLEDPSPSLAAHRKKYPADTHISLIHSADMLPGEWRVEKVGSFMEVIPDVTDPEINRWTKQVESFDSPEAIEHGKTADTTPDCGDKRAEA